MKTILPYFVSHVLLYLLLGCAVEHEHPTGTYISTCSTEDGSPHNGFSIFHVGKDTIIVKSLNDLLSGTSQGTCYLTTAFTEPLIHDHEFEIMDTITASITDQELTMQHKGFFGNSAIVAKKLHDSLSEVHLADNRMVANKIFERWSDRSRWIFSADNRLEVRSYDNKPLYEFEHTQFYSIDSFASYRFLNIQPVYKKNYFINTISDSYIALELVGCVPVYDTLRFVKDTLIESVLPPAAVLAEQPKYAPKTYSTYWYETQWTFTFMNEGTFKYLPNGHASSGHLYMGTYEEQDGTIKLDYTQSDFANISAASDPTRLFRLDDNHLRCRVCKMLGRSSSGGGR